MYVQRNVQGCIKNNKNHIVSQVLPALNRVKNIANREVVTQTTCQTFNGQLIHSSNNTVQGHVG